MPWLQEGGQVRLVGSASMDGFVAALQNVTSSWFFLSTLNICYIELYSTHQVMYMTCLSYLLRSYCRDPPFTGTWLKHTVESMQGCYI